jgi:hypothetical protein
MRSYSELAKLFNISEQRVKNLLHHAGLLCKEPNPKLHWQVTEKGWQYFSEGVWSDEVRDIIDDAMDAQSAKLVADKSGVDHKTCENCSQSKPYYDFNESKKNVSGLTKWCKECLAKL